MNPAEAPPLPLDPPASRLLVKPDVPATRILANGLDAAEGIPLPEVVDLLPRRDGRRLHVSTVFRWGNPGVLAADGERVRLETFRIGRLLFTTRTALARFLSRLSGPAASSRAANGQADQTHMHARVGQRLKGKTR